MEGKIIKAIAGFYYIHTGACGIYACRARGIFRKDGRKPLVGDNVVFEVLSEEKKEGNLTDILPRKNMLIRPAAANLDQALVIFALREPDPNLNLLDRFLIYMGTCQIPAVIYFNKDALDRSGTAERYRGIYEAAGYRVLTGSVRAGSAEPVEEVLSGKTTVLAGPSGVGKSSLTNLLHREDRMEVGELSERIKRGKQTTRHTELFMLHENTYLLDTPGFTSLSLPGLPAAQVRDYFPEFEGPSGECRFAGCLHIQEKEQICGVKRALSEGKISAERYENYLQIYEEQKKAERR